MTLDAVRLSPFGAFHTVLGLVAVGTGLFAVLRHGEIPWRSRVGRIYLVATLLTALTGFGLFRHGGFGKPHALGVLTLVVLALAAAGARRSLGAASPYVETVGTSLTLFFHTVPGFTETFTRLPLGAPLFADDRARGLQLLVGASFLVFLLGAAVQVRRLRARTRAKAPTAGGQPVHPARS